MRARDRPGVCAQSKSAQLHDIVRVGIDVAGDDDDAGAPFDLDTGDTAWDAHILVVDDNELNQAVVLLLGQFG